MEVDISDIDAIIIVTWSIVGWFIISWLSAKRTIKFLGSPTADKTIDRIADRVVSMSADAGYAFSDQAMDAVIEKLDHKYAVAKGEYGAVVKKMKAFKEELIQMAQMQAAQESGAEIPEVIKRGLLQRAAQADMKEHFGPEVGELANYVKGGLIQKIVNRQAGGGSQSAPSGGDGGYSPGL